jgi:23S rRNA (guanosine2251-2'-O)-methyltransferase
MRHNTPRPTPGNLVMGIHPVSELLKSDKEVEKILINKDLMNRQEGMDIVYACRTKEIPYQPVPVEKLNRVTQKMHQGVIAFVSPITYQKVENLLPFLFEDGIVPFFLVLDRITDVRNFGAIARTADCAGVHAIIIPEKGGAQINEDAMKTSAGALNHIPVCRERDLGRTLNYLNDSGVSIIACTEKGADSIFDTDFTGPVALVMGSEEDGISEFLLRKAHHIAQLPQVGKIGSLNVSVAAGIAMYEALRQRLVAP